MTGDLVEGTLGTPEGGSQGQPESGNKGDGFTGNIKDIPQVRQWEAARDRREAQLQKELEEARRMAEQAIRQSNAVIKAVTDANPDVGAQLIQQARIDEQTMELETLRAERAEREQAQAARNWHLEAAAAAGYDVTDPRFLAGLDQTLQTGNPLFVEQAKRTLALDSVKQQQPEKPDEPEIVRPPAGGVSRPSASVQQISRVKEYAELVKQNQGNSRELGRLRNMYADVYPLLGDYLSGKIR